MDKTAINIAIARLQTQNLESTQINSVTDYFIFEQLLRPLVTYSATGELVGDLAENWKIFEDHKSYEITIKSNQFFSDGSTITAEDVVQSLKRLQQKAFAVHGAELANVKLIEAKDKSTIKIQLKEKDIFFLYDLEHPEYRVLHKSDRIENHQKFLVTSGAYSIKAHDKDSIQLIPNKHQYPTATPAVVIEESSIKKNDLSSIDIFWSSGKVKDEINKELINKKFNIHNTQLGFTYWLSINPNIFSLEERHIIRSALHFNDDDIKNIGDCYKKANQLYLSGGPGRLKYDELPQFNVPKNESILKSMATKSVQIFIQKDFPLENVIKKNLSKIFNKVDITHYNNFSEYADIIKDSNRFGIILANNDFSSIDLRGSLNVTFNKDRPLILTKNNNEKIFSMLDLINTTENATIRNNMIKDIGKYLLQESYIEPVYYFNLVWFYSSDIGLQNLLPYTSDVSIWKISKKQKN